MQKPVRTTRFSLGAEPTVESLLELSDHVKGLSPTGRVSFDKEFGQRDQEYIMVTITETDW